MKFFHKKNVRGMDFNNIPPHIGIIMDGNGRWAKRRGLPRNAGHRAGAETLRKITEYADSIGVKVLTAYAFSTENWKRPKAEVDGIMSLLVEYLSDAKRTLGGKNAVIKVIGDFTPLSDEIRQKIAETEDFTKDNTGILLNIALNYGGQDEIVSAVHRIQQEGKEVTRESIADHLYTAGLPPVDLIIRPSGEFRLSNFLLWQSAYAELWFDQVLWPDFKPHHLEKAICDFQQRNRRYGG
jgi:undecaprenyl diphosphate synthase